MSNHHDQGYQASLIGNKEGQATKGSVLSHSSEATLRSAYDECQKCFHSYTQNNKGTGLAEAIGKLQAEFKQAHEEGGAASQKHIELVKQCKELLASIEKAGISVPK